MLLLLWFTDFENKRFWQCQDATGKLLQDGDGASIKCVRDACDQLDAAARQAACWKSLRHHRNVQVVLVERVSLNPHKKR